MSLKRNTLFFLICLFFVFGTVKAQLLTDLGKHHNQFFIGSGYTQSFGNVSYGINHKRYFKSIKRDVVGILDFVSPLSTQYFTKFIFRKGFQVDVYKKNNFKFPVALISSSVKKSFHLFLFHDIITDLYLLPGVYKEKYTIAADLSIQFLLFHQLHKGVIDPIKKHHRENISIGIVLARNIDRFSFIFRGGFQQISDWEFITAPIYATGTIAYKLNFKKHSHESKCPSGLESDLK